MMMMVHFIYWYLNEHRHYLTVARVWWHFLCGYKLFWDGLLTTHGIQIEPFLLYM